MATRFGRRRAVAALACAVCIGSAARKTAADFGSLLFLPPVTYGLAGSPVSVSAADMNSDGKIDLIVSIANGEDLGSVGVLLGHGDGTFAPTVAYSSGGYLAGSAAVADVDGDGRPDIVVANACATPISAGNCLTSGSVGVLLGNGDGTFRSVLMTYDTGGRFTNSIAVADINGDSQQDVVVGNYGVSVAVFLGKGDGTFQFGASYSSEHEFSVAFADVNVDGKSDLLVANLYNDVAVLLGNGNGTFQPAVTHASGGFYASSVTADDVNGDRKPDLLVTHWFVNNEDLEHDGVIGVLLGNGDGTFQPAVVYDASGHQPSGIASGDVNGDGKPDLVIANCAASGRHCGSGYGVLAVLLNNADGTFQPAMTYDTGGVNAISVALADVNADGTTDLLVANSCASGGCAPGDDSVGVLVNVRADDIPPLINLSATPENLWPPNNKMRVVTVSGSITDRGSGLNADIAMYAVKDEYGDVQPNGVMPVGPAGYFSFTIWLQASRGGTDRDGRRYTVTVQATDNAGNVGSKTAVVTVLHDQRH